MYLPKSKYSIKYTNGGYLASIDDNSEYIGSYIETSDKKFIAGTKLNGPKLKLLSDKATNMDRNQTAEIYSSTLVGGRNYSSLRTKKNIPSSKPPPTEEDYKRGSFLRHFLFKNNEPYIIYETSKKYIDDFKINLDKNLYTLETIKWSLIGEESVIQNANKIKQKRRFNPYIGAVLDQPNEYVRFEEDKNMLQKLKNPNEMLDEIPTFTLKQWQMFSSLDKEKLILKYGEVNISDL